MKNHLQEYLESIDHETFNAVKFVEHLFRDAIEHEATDIHIEPWGDGYTQVRLRCGGVLVALRPFPRPLGDHEAQAIRNVLKQWGGCDILKPDEAHDGHIPEITMLEGFGCRLSFIPSIHGEKVVIRVFNQSKHPCELDKLGLSEKNKRALEDMMKRPNGLLLVTGPTGSGKSFTLYALLKQLLKDHGDEKSISTVEDPVEMVIPHVSQTNVNEKKKLGFAKALRHLLRQDPQAIMVGEIRDPETANIAFRAGLTGHLVLSTLHAGSTSGAFPRLTSLKVEPVMIASTLAAVFGQRLLRRNCGHCSKPYAPAEHVLDRCGLPQADGYRNGTGCHHCRAGYLGRIAVGEYLDTRWVEKEVLRSAHAADIHETAINSGMRTLLEDAQRRVQSGETTPEELLRVLGSAI